MPNSGPGSPTGELRRVRKSNATKVQRSACERFARERLILGSDAALNRTFGRRMINYHSQWFESNDAGFRSWGGCLDTLTIRHHLLTWSLELSGTCTDSIEVGVAPPICNNCTTSM
eukprot:4211414-Prymnesium_polylepis.3